MQLLFLINRVVMMLPTQTADLFRGLIPNPNHSRTLPAALRGSLAVLGVLLLVAARLPSFSTFDLKLEKGMQTEIMLVRQKHGSPCRKNGFS